MSLPVMDRIKTETGRTERKEDINMKYSGNFNGKIKGKNNREPELKGRKGTNHWSPNPHIIVETKKKRRSMTQKYLRSILPR